MYKINILKVSSRFRANISLCLIAILYANCNKIVQVPEPISSVTSSQVFSNDATATSAILGIYSNMSITRAFCSMSTTIYTGESADELTDQTSGNEYNDYYLSNTLTALNANYTSLTAFWQPAYYDIYCANSVMAGIEASAGMTSNAKIELVGEAKFIRAFCYFYLTNLFGDIPLVLSNDFNQTVHLSKTPRTQIYQQIVNDLLDAQKALPQDFVLSGGQRIRATKWAATALLARVYLYQGDWAGAESEADSVINSGLFSLVPLPLVPSNGIPVSDSDVFQANSKEAILQLQSSGDFAPFATFEGNFFVPYNSSYAPRMWLTSELLSAFEPGDLRRLDWVDSSNGNQIGTPYYYFPFKYKENVGDPANITENYTLIRFAEQFLIRAEAEANLKLMGLAVDDLNTIRTRAGLDSLPVSLSPDSVVAAIRQEDRIEFFGEFGHRWFDLQRWGIAITVLDKISYKNINNAQLLYPIPLVEIQDDPNLTQNDGY